VRPAAGLVLALVAGNAIQVRAGASVLGPTTRPASTEPAAIASPLPHLVVMLNDLQRIYRTAFLLPVKLVVAVTAPNTKIVGLAVTAYRPEGTEQVFFTDNCLQCG
jgi:hypothetical protein